MKTIVFVGLFLCTHALAAPARITKTQITPFFGRYVFESGESKYNECYRVLYVGLDKHDEKRNLMTLVFRGAHALDDWSMEIYPMLNHEIPHPSSPYPDDTIEYKTRVSTSGEKTKLYQLAITRRSGKALFLEHINMESNTKTLKYTRSSNISNREKVTCSYTRD